MVGVDGTGKVVLRFDPHPRIINKSFAQFVLQAEKPTGIILGLLLVSGRWTTFTVVTDVAGSLGWTRRCAGEFFLTSVAEGNRAIELASCPEGLVRS